MFFRKKKWSKCPGCFERHLQRRCENVLFPIERRSASEQEIEEARQRDREEQDNFNNKLSNFAERTSNLEEVEVSKISDLLQDLQTLIEEAASIGGDAWEKVPSLENVEENLMNHLNEVLPEGKDLLERAQSLSHIERVPFLAQRKRLNSPIPKDEEIATLLSEDLSTIAVIGSISRNMTDFKPSTADIEDQLSKAVHQGFSKKNVQKIIKAWNEI
ncbi:MAG: hypothetical protein OEV42_15625 [Deltaproteobacteria bacterium]|nr:hypothetical protein [Deltaproteobacteria bacterium]